MKKRLIILGWHILGVISIALAPLTILIWLFTGIVIPAKIADKIIKLS